MSYYPNASSLMTPDPKPMKAVRHSKPRTPEAFDREIALGQAQNFDWPAGNGTHRAQPTMEGQRK
jgi:hypothetical protein